MYVEKPEKVTTIDIINVLDESLHIYCTVAGSDYEMLGIIDGSRLEIERCHEPVAEKIFLCSVDDSVKVAFITNSVKKHLENISFTLEEYEKLKNEGRIILFGMVKRIFNRSRKSKLRH